ncbi:MAG: hypothetical protein AB1568_14170 [Thermodesulfobacteriota bacterium]
MENLLIGLLICGGICLPVAVAWHSFIDRYLLASVISSINAIILFTLLLYGRHADFSGYFWLLTTTTFLIATCVSFLTGLPFAIYRKRR